MPAASLALAADVARADPQAAAIEFARDDGARNLAATG